MTGDEGQLMERIAALPTAALSDALDALELRGSLHGIEPLTSTAKAAGRAFTVAYEPVGSERGSIGDFLDDVPAGGVVVIDNFGRTDCTVWGGLMSETAVARGLAGTVIHGACRDVATTLEHGYPVFSGGRFMRTGKDRVRLAAVQIPLTISEVAIVPGDLVVADADGVVVVAAGQLDRVVELAENIERTEQRISAAVRAGTSLRWARADVGYHHLQRRG